MRKDEFKKLSKDEAMRCLEWADNQLYSTKVDLAAGKTRLSMGRLQAIERVLGAVYLGLARTEDDIIWACMQSIEIKEPVWCSRSRIGQGSGH